MNLLDRISIKGTVFSNNQNSGHLLSLFMNDHSLEEKCFVQKHFIKYFFILLFLLCFVTPVLITFSLNVFITFAVSFLQKNFECYETSSKLRTNFVRCETLITNLSPTTNGSPWQPVSSCGPSCSSNSSYRPSCPSSGQQLVSQCRKRLSCPSSPEPLN